MIVGLAGHIDHGKTSLVRALTGVETDRLPEEKARGISIELGYAYLDLPDPRAGSAGAALRIGFVDVPGHERLVRTMLAGATGVDFGLLVIAADDGPMPQTREHLAVLALLGLRRGAVVLTKADRVDAARLAQVQHEAQRLLEATPLAGVPTLPVSSTTGAGLSQLRDVMAEAASSLPPRAATDSSGEASVAGASVDLGRPGFRLAVDRSFTLPGIGTVVTGSVHAGRVRVGDELEVAPATGRPLRCRVRSLHAADRPVAEAGAGERCALGLAGVDRDALGRGRWLVSSGLAFATDRLDLRLRVWRDEAGPLRSGASVHLHLGTEDVLASVAVLGPDDRPDAGPDAPTGLPADDPAPLVDAVAPGGAAFVQLVLRQPVAAWHADRVVLRDASASRTLAGGEVLDPFAPARSRRTPARLVELQARTLPSAAERLAGAVRTAALGVSLERWAIAEGRVGVGLRTANDDPQDRSDWLINAGARLAVEERVLGALRGFHERHPELPGMDTAALRRLAVPRLAEPLWRRMLAGLRVRDAIVQQSAFACLPEHALQLSEGDDRVLRRLEPRIEAAGAEGAWVRDLARGDPLDEPALRAALARLARHGSVQQIVKDLYWSNGRIDALAKLARDLALGEDGGLTVGRFRDAADLGRKRAIQLLEYFDRIGLLQRVGELRRLRTDTALFATPSPSTPLQHDLMRG